jgi:hypothetical protein
MNTQYQRRMGIRKGTLASGVLIAACAGVIEAATVGLYTFDTIADTTDTAGGERFYDSSGNNLHLTRASQFGTLGLSSQPPTVAPSGSLALSNSGVPGLVTPSTNQFSLGTTGQLTIEFWYKPQAATTIHSIAAQTDSNSAWSLYQKFPVAGKAALEFYTLTSTGQEVKVATPAVFDANSGWNHIALTVDAAGVGRFYRNGTEVASNTGFTNYSAYSSTLTLGAQPGTGGFTNNFQMDDFRISNVALPSGTGTGAGQLAWNTSLSQGLTTVNRPADFGKQWLRNNPFTITSWGSTHDAADLPLYENANMTSAQSGWYIAQQNYNIDQHYLGSYASLTDVARAQMHIANNLPNLTAWFIKDEIAPGDIPGIAQIANYVRSIDPDGLIYAGMGSSNPAYITQVVQAVKPDALIHGYYPFTGTSGTDVNGHFSDFVYYRQGAIQNNLPFFTFIQSFDDSGTIENRRLPSESELRFEVFTKLTGGAQGVAYFVFDASNGGPAVTNALLNRQGNPSTLYAPAQQMNAELLNLGRSLRYIETTEWRYVPGMTGGSSNPVPQDMIAFAPGASWSPHVVSVNVNTANAANKGVLKDGVIGFFEDDAGKTYFMLTNVFHGTGVSSAASSLDFLMQFDSSVNSLLRLNRLTGEPERVNLTANLLSLTLPGGTGDLFKYDDGMFAGIQLGDTDLDEDVDLSDLATLASHYGAPTGSRWSWGDFDLDGDVDLSDLSTLATYYGSGESQAFADFAALASVPEPASSAVLLAVAWGLGRRRREIGNQ